MNYHLVFFFIAFVCSFGLSIRNDRRPPDTRNSGRRPDTRNSGRRSEEQTSLLKALGVRGKDRSLGFPLRFGAVSFTINPKAARPDRRSNASASNASRCLPDAFQMPIRQTTFLSKGPRTSLLRSEVHLAVDNKRQFAAFNETVWINSRMILRSSEIIDVANQTVYVVDQKRSCSRGKKVAGIKLQLCLPATSKRISSVVLGAGATQAGLPVDVWEVPVPVSQLKVFLVATQRDFTPVTETIVATAPKGPGRVMGFQETGFFNFTVGIKDPSVFKVPPPCSGPEPKPDSCFEDCPPEW